MKRSKYLLGFASAVMLLSCPSGAYADEPTSERADKTAGQTIPFISSEELLSPLNFAEQTNNPYILTSTQEGQSERIPENSNAAPKKTNPTSGSYIYGFRWAPIPYAWCEVRTDNGDEDVLWTDSSCYLYNAFERNGHIEGFGFSSAPPQYYLVYTAAYGFEGQVIKAQSYYTVPKSDSYKVPLRVAYDPVEDMCYGFSENYNTGTDYYFIKMNPDTHEATIIRSEIPVNDVCWAITYSPKDKSIYGVTFTGKLVKIDKTSGEQTMIVDTGYDSSSGTSKYFGGLIYSPKDKAFYWQCIFNEPKCTRLIKIDDEAKTFSLVKEDIVENTGDRHQFSCLITPDDYETPAAPKAVTITSKSFTETSASYTVKLPTLTNAGASLTGKVTLEARLDGTVVKSEELDPGASYSVTFSDLDASYHRFRFYAIANNEKSVRTEEKVFIGHDTPKAPENVTLEATKVSWDAVTTGVNGIDLTNEGVTYDVYLNGEKQGNTSATSMNVTLPTEQIHSNIAYVVAINQGKESEATYSNRLTSGEYLLPDVLIEPTEGDAYLVTVIDANNDGSTWYYDIPTKRFIYRYNYSNAGDDWLITPAINFTDASVLYEFGMDVQTLANRLEKFEMWIGPDPDPSTMTKLFADEVNSYQHDQQPVTFSTTAAARGINYIGIHAVSDKNKYLMAVTNIFAKKTTTSTNGPDAPTDIEITRGAAGALTATAKFKMPTKTIAGADIAAGTTLTVKAENITFPDNETVSVNGTPGQECTLSFTTSTGSNEVKFTTYEGDTQGFSASETFWAGLDIPALLTDFAGKLTDDPMVGEFTWTAPGEVGANGGYVDTSSLKYYYCTQGSDSWSITQEVPAEGFNYTLPDGSEQKNRTYGIVVQSSGGLNRQVNKATLVSGLAYTLPFADDFLGGTHNTPIMVEYPTDEYTAKCGFANPSGLGYATTSDRAITIMTSGGNLPQYGQIHLPYCTTEGTETPQVIIYGLAVPDLTAPTSIWVKAYGEEPYKLGTFTGADGQGWVRFAYDLPSQFVGKKWIDIYIDAEIDSATHYSLVDSYRVTAGLSNDISVASFTPDNAYIIGVDNTITATIENEGRSATTVPTAELAIYRDSELLTTLTNTNAGDELPLDTQMDLTFSLNPNADMAGKVTFKLDIKSEDDNLDNNVAEVSSSIVKGAGLAVFDLTATRDEETPENVNLAWTPLTMFNGEETFESFESFNMAKQLGDFKNIDKDKSQTYTWESWDFPGEEDPHAFIVFDASYSEIPESSRQNLAAHSGNKYLLALAPLNYVAANDWLISPPVQGGTDVSFYLNILSANYGKEYVGVYYSTTDDEISSFKGLGFTYKSTLGWEEVTNTLPEDAKYFAIRYYSTDTFGIMIDDLCYTPEGGLPTLVGFDVLRNGEQIATAVNTTESYTDEGTENAEITYNIVPVTTNESGEEKRHYTSNTAKVSAYESVEAVTKAAAVYQEADMIVISGAAGKLFSISTVDGTSLYSGKVAYDKAGYRVEKGIYIISVDGKVNKMLVK